MGTLRPLFNTPGLGPVYGPYIPYVPTTEGDSLTNGFADHEGYNTLKFITKDVLTPTLDSIDSESFSDINVTNFNMNKFGYGLGSGILKNYLPTIASENTKMATLIDYGVDVWDGVDHAIHVNDMVKAAQGIDTITDIGRAGGTFTTASSEVSGLSTATSIAGKAAPWMAAISTGISGAETVMNFANGDVNEGIGSLGETLMSGAVVLGASGVGAPVAAGIAVVGGVLWAGSKIYKHRDKLINGAKTLWNGAKNAWSKLGGLFG